MALTEKQQELRKGKLSATMAARVMSGDPEKIMSVWRECIEDPDYTPTDLSDVWAVQLGLLSESLNLNWYSKTTGHSVSRYGEVVTGKDCEWLCCTLDGWDDALNCPIECKHVNQFKKPEFVIQDYMAQMHVQMLVTGARRVILSVIVGSLEPQKFEVLFDTEYANALVEICSKFWQHVLNKTPPIELPVIQAPHPITEFIKLDFTGNNAWASAAGEWLASVDAHALYCSASEAIKALMPENCNEGFGYGIRVKRNARGALSIKQIPQNAEGPSVAA